MDIESHLINFNLKFRCTNNAASTGIGRSTMCKHTFQNILYCKHSASASDLLVMEMENKMVEKVLKTTVQYLGTC